MQFRFRLEFFFPELLDNGDELMMVSNLFQSRQLFFPDFGARMIRMHWRSRDQTLRCFTFWCSWAKCPDVFESCGPLSPFNGRCLYISPTFLAALTDDQTCLRDGRCVRNLVHESWRSWRGLIPFGVCISRLFLAEAWEQLMPATSWCCIHYIAWYFVRHIGILCLCILCHVL